MNAARPSSATARRRPNWGIARAREACLIGRDAPAARITRLAAVRVAAAVGLAAIGLAALPTSGATASEGAAPYAISDISAAPTAGFKISDISTVPTAEVASAPTDDPLPTAGLTVSDIGPAMSADQTTDRPVTADTNPLGSRPAAVYPGQTTSIPN